MQTRAWLECLHEAELPKGLCNVVIGRGDVVGAELVRNPDVAKISFTGSVAVGKSIMRDGAATMKRVTLELGGKSPNILLDDADLDKAIPTALAIAFMNSGQACVAGTRLLVPKNRLDAVKRAIKEAIRAFPVGDPADPKTAVGPMVSQKQYERVQSYIRKGIEEGAEVLVGGEGHPEGLEAGYFVKPTVFVNVKNDMTIAREEIFGPVLCVITYDNDEDAIRIANDTNYGLHAYVSGTDVRRARRVASQILAGRVAINGMLDDQQAPFGGFQELRRWPRIRHVWDRSVSRTACDPRGLKGRRMSKHVAISPEEAADRLAIRELIEAYAHCADRRDAKGQMALFTTDTHFVVYMNAKDPKPSQELHSREALAPVFADLNQYDATTHFVGQSTIFTLNGDRATGEAYCIAHHLTVDGEKRRLMVAYLRYLDTFAKIDGDVAVCRTPAVRRLAGGASTVVNFSAADQTRLVIVGATGMVGGYALRYALGHPDIGLVTSNRTEDAWHLAPQTEGGFAPGFRRLLRARGRALESERGGLLPRRIYRCGVGCRASQDHGRLHDRVRSELSMPRAPWK